MPAPCHISLALHSTVWLPLLWDFGRRANSGRKGKRCENNLVSAAPALSYDVDAETT